MQDAAAAAEEPSRKRAKRKTTAGKPRGANLAAQNAELRAMRDQTLALLRERKADLEELRVREAFTHAALDALADGVITIREDGCIVDFNGAAAKLFRYTPAELRDRDVRTLFENVTLRGGKQAQRSVRSGLWGQFEDGCELLGRRGDGSNFPLHLTMREVRLPDRKLFTGVFRDVTAQKRTEASLQHAKESAEAASRTKSEYLAAMSHEIRTPMSAILGYTELLLDPGLSADERREHVATVRRSGEHLLVLINDILDISRIEAGRVQLESRSCSPREIVEEAVCLLKAKAQAKGLALETEVDPGLPAEIESDRTRILQILVNLIGNALKFTAQGKVRLTAKMLEARNAKPQLCFEVQDTGIGMSKEQVSSLFKPFTQVNASIVRQYGGSGLGLAISRRLAELLGGTIGVVSELGRGSTFRVTIAAKLRAPAPGAAVAGAAPAAPAAPPPLAPPATEASISVAGLRVLIVDDSGDNRRLLSFFIGKGGAKIQEAANGREAVEMVLAARKEGVAFDAIILDMQMPVMSGYAAAALLREERVQTPIIALTANAFEGEREKCLHAGCNDYLAKPVNRRHLLSRIAACVQASRAPQPVNCTPL
ncbi:MAG: ATP-binding protein [Planctomycetes bacterium]|nr:ATP-binding protein [Planctomycetota bacterium]